MKKVYISSPQGSGNSYMKEFLTENVYDYVTVYSHKIEDILENQNHIFILRNPKDCISSAVYRYSKEKSGSVSENLVFNDFDINTIKQLISTYTNFYINFLKKSKLKSNLYIIPFDYFFNNQKEFLNKIVNKFNLTLHEDISLSSNEDFILKKMMQFDNKTRVPSKKTKNRIFIENLIEKEALYKEAYALYLEILQSTKNMVQ
jgi:hypothetical protein